MAAPIALTAAGFTASGVAAGSLAAWAQSTFYGGATGGLFSLLQSAGAAGLGAAGYGTAAAVGGATGIGAKKVIDNWLSQTNFLTPADFKKKASKQAKRIIGFHFTRLPKNIEKNDK